MKKNQAFIKKHFFLICLVITSILIFITILFHAFVSKGQALNDENLEEVADSNVLLIQKPSSDNTIEDLSEAEEPTDNDSSTDTNISENDDLYSSLQPSDTVATLSIPTLNINYPILADCNTELLKISLTKFWGCNPNEVGNFCVVGHNYKNGKFFSKLLSIKNGDIVKITDLTGRTLDYSVYDTFIVDPEDTDCTSQLTDGNTEITLITCYYVNNEAHASKRFIVKARANV